MTRVVVVALAVLAACTERYGGPLAVPKAGTQEPAHEPLDIAWQTGLYIFPQSTLLGGGGPMGVFGAHARALEPARCSARVAEDLEARPPALVVIGFAEGQCDVELTYRHPVHDDVRTVTFHVVFDPPEQLPVAAVGSAMPRAPFVVVPGGSLPIARCEPHDDRGYGPFKCFVAEMPFGTPRFAKDAYELAWFDSRSPRTFALCVRRDVAGTVLGMRARLDWQRGDPITATPDDLVWGTPDPECSE
jgi:hypothetical protein